jgi:hypothetical protein
MQDFPAAHSMDTTWFAIDADDCVGIFEPNEGGAVPQNLPDIENEINLVDCLLKDKPEIIRRVQPLKIESVIEDINIESIQDIKILFAGMKSFQDYILKVRIPGIILKI